MRSRLFFIVFIGLAIHPASGQSPAATPPPLPAFPTMQQMLEAPIGSVGAAAPMDTSKLLADLRTAPPPETRTDEQLLAILAAYVGHWRGDYFVRTPAGREVAHFPVEVDYKLGEKNGHPVLLGVTSYANKGEKVVDTSTIWVEKGEIVSELSHGDRVEKYTARTRGATLVWFTRDFTKSLIDYSMTESLSLTGTGGTLSIQGFEALPNTSPPAIVFETAELKLDAPQKLTVPVSPNSPGKNSTPVKAGPAVPAKSGPAVSSNSTTTPKPPARPPAIYINEP